MADSSRALQAFGLWAATAVQNTGKTKSPQSDYRRLPGEAPLKSEACFFHFIFASLARTSSAKRWMCVIT